MKIILFALTLFTLISCGDSPLLSDDEEKSGVQGLNSSSSTLYLGNNQVIPKFDGEVSLYENTELVFLVFNKDNELYDPQGEIKLELWMPDHGHGSFPIVVERISKGMYKASKIFFTMPGFWNLRFQQYVDGNMVEESKWPINL